MDLTIYDIIKRAVVTEKAYRLNRGDHAGRRKLVLEVHMHANKPQIEEALEKLFNVKVEKIGIIIRKGKARRIRARKNMITYGKDVKRALVTLKEGYSIDAISQTGTDVELSHGDNAQSGSMNAAS